MSYQVLARKWRPKRFAELVGQEHVKSTLINALEMGRLHHAYLFTGTRGVGKTTIARIFAKSLNCEQGITAEPCGQCDTCLAIENGHYVDLIEIDAASRTKVEDTREILDNVQYAPTRGRFKVYLIDEVHMLSRHSFNALLKTLEEPPGHVKFLLATTDPQKLPITILSRCLQFNLKALLRSEIKNHLEQILNAESIEFEDEALVLLAKAADGSLRDALSLTDQAIAQAGGKLVLAVIERMLGTIDKQWSVKLLAHIVNNDGEKAMETVEQIALFMPDYQHLLDQLLSMFHLSAMTQLVPGAAQIDESMHAFITRLAQKLSAEDLQLYYQILLNGKKDLDLAPTAKIGFEMLLLRLLAFKPVKVVSRPEGEVLASTELQAAMEVPELPEPEAPEPTQAPSLPEVNEAKPQSVEPAPEHFVEAQQLDEQTLNAQQDDILAQAQAQGFQPVESVGQQVVEKPAKNEEAETEQPAYLAMDLAAQQAPSEAPIQEPLNEPDSQPPGQQIEQQSAHQEQQQDSEQVPQAQKPSQPSQQALVQQTPQYEDPVAAILANRNLSLDDMFGSDGNEVVDQPGQFEQEQPSSPNGGEDSSKKPEAPTQAVVTPTAQPAESNHQAQSVVENYVDPQPDAFDLQSPVDAFVHQGEPVEQQPAWQQSAPEYVQNESVPEPQDIQQPPPVEPQTEVVQDPQVQEQPVGPQPEQQIPPQPAEPELPRWAHEVDEWAALIEKMGLGGLVRLLAVQSIYQKSEKTVYLTVYESEQHLDSPGLRGQLQKALSLALNEPVELELQFTSEQFNTPLNIQRQIDADRLARAKQLIYHDPIIVAFQQQFGATVNDESITAVG